MQSHLPFQLALFLGMSVPNFLDAESPEIETRRLIVQLRASSESQAKCMELLERIADIGPESHDALPLITPWLKREEVPHVAMECVANMRGEAVDAVRLLLNDPEKKVRLTALEIVQWMERDAGPLVPDVVRLAAEKPSDIQIEAIRTLGMLGLTSECAPKKTHEDLGRTPTSQASLTQAIQVLADIARNDADPNVRGRSLWALASVDTSGDDAVPVLADAIQDKGVAIRGPYRFAVKSTALRELSGVAASTNGGAVALLHLFRKDDLRKDIFKYEVVSRVLAQLGVREAIPLLEVDLAKNDLPNPEMEIYDWIFSGGSIPDSYVCTCIRVCAARSLIQLSQDNHAAHELLLNVLEQDKWSQLPRGSAKWPGAMDPRVYAAMGLGYLGENGVSALPALNRAFTVAQQEDPNLARTVAAAIARIDALDQKCVELNLTFQIDSNPQIAAKILGARLEKVIPFSVRAAFSHSAQFRDFHISLLSHGNGVGIVKIVERAFQAIEHGKFNADGDTFFDSSALVTLQQMGSRAEPAFDHVVSRLESNNHNVRAAAAQLLGEINTDSETSVPLLIKRLKDDRVIVRVRAAEALGRFGSDAVPALPQLRELRNDDYHWVRRSAAKSAAEISRHSAEHRRSRKQ